MFDSDTLEVLGRDECLTLISEVPVGRIIFTYRALPAVLPVNFALHDDSVIIRTPGGSKLSTAARNAIVAFEADQIARDWEAGWSVTVVGHASEATDPDELAKLSALALRSWAPDRSDHYIRIAAELVSGRRIRRGHVPNGGGLGWDDGQASPRGNQTPR
jgi:nitroimidazol reductase NimA-like FMN-containing flavoprotein (pyridoxamine 5'-phosphate oxidase superfamily)